MKGRREALRGKDIVANIEQCHGGFLSKHKLRHARQKAGHKISSLRGSPRQRVSGTSLQDSGQYRHTAIGQQVHRRNLDHDINVATGPRIAARAGPEQRSMDDATRPQFGLALLKLSDDLIAVHGSDYTAKAVLRKMAKVKVLLDPFQGHRVKECVTKR